ncbi:MAG: hypothetical protein SGILL_001519 [Bacillariaceae sp.]
MGKRTNDRQMTKDDYEQEVEPQKITHGFPKASAQEMKKRRIVQRGANGGGGFGGGFGTINFSAPPRAAVPDFAVALNSGGHVQAERSQLTKEQGDKVTALTKNYFKHCSNVSNRFYDPMAAERFMATYNSIMNPRTEAPATAPAPSPAPAPSSLFASPPAAAPSSDLFSGSTTPKPAFSFGTIPSAPVTAPVAPTKGLSASGSLFGDALARSDNNNGNNKTPVNSASFGGFSNAPSPAVTAAVAAPAPASNAQGNNTQEEDDDGGGTEAAARNEDDHVKISFECTGGVFRTVDVDGKNKKKWIAGRYCHMKLERNDQTGVSQVVCRDSTTGGVNFNMRIVKDHKFTKTPKNKKGNLFVLTLAIVEEGKPAETIYFDSDDNEALCDALNTFAQNA